MPPEPYRPQLPPPPPPPFAPATGWAHGAVVLLAATIVRDVAVVLSDLAGTELLTPRDDGRGWLFVATAVVFLVWLHHAYRNLIALGARRLRFSPGWALGWFFVPIANCILPYLVVKDVWLESDPKAGLDDAPRRWRARATPLLACWWGTWLLSGFAGALTGSSANMRWRSSWSIGAAEPRVAQRRLAWNFEELALVEELLRIAAAALAIAVVRGIDARQRQKAGRGLGEAVPPGEGGGGLAQRA